MGVRSTSQEERVPLGPEIRCSRGIGEAKKAAGGSSRGNREGNGRARGGSPQSQRGEKRASATPVGERSKSESEEEYHPLTGDPREEEDGRDPGDPPAGEKGVKTTAGIGVSTEKSGGDLGFPKSGAIGHAQRQ